MLKKLMNIKCVAIILFITVGAYAIELGYFDNDSGDQRWFNAENWEDGNVPSMAAVSDVRIGESQPGVPVIVDANGGAAASFQWLAVGVDTIPGQVNVESGGYLGVPGCLTYLGGHPWGTSGSYGVINVDGAGSVAYSESWYIASEVDKSGTGIVNITNGGGMVMGYWGQTIGTVGTAVINVINGSLTYWGGGLTMGTGGKIVLYPDGVITMNGDQTTLAQQLIDSGNVVSTSSRCGLNVEYKTSGWTDITVTNCACSSHIDMDFNYDCYVDLLDLAVFVESWLDCTDPLNENCSQ